MMRVDGSYLERLAVELEGYAGRFREFAAQLGDRQIDVQLEGWSHDGEAGTLLLGPLCELQEEAALALGLARVSALDGDEALTAESPQGGR